MELNRSGDWPRAAARAEAFLAAPVQRPQAQRCEAIYHLAYARTLLGQSASARQALARFDDRCRDQSGWVVREMAALRNQLSTRAVVPARVLSDDGWDTVDPAVAGLDTLALRLHRERCERSAADACLVAHRGKIVQEWYGPAYQEPMHTMSSVKSWTGLLAGILIQEGRLGLDDPVARWIPEWRAGAEAGVTVRHLLTMTSGLQRRWSVSHDGRRGVGEEADKNAFVFSLPLDYAPGTRWSYSNEGVQLLSPILQRAAGEPLEEFARKRLFEPLDMGSTRLRLDEAGNVWTYADAATSLRDFAKVCQLMLQGGRWKDRQVVPEEWVQLSVRPIPQSSEYGMLWWIVPGGYATQGYLDTNCYVFPEQELVVARMQSRPKAGAVTYQDGELFRLLLRIAPRSGSAMQGTKCSHRVQRSGRGWEHMVQPPHRSLQATGTTPYFGSARDEWVPVIRT